MRWGRCRSICWSDNHRSLTVAAQQGCHRILMVASEASPFAKTGGAGRVLGSLPAALARLGDEVVVVLPKYRGVDPETRIWEDLRVQVGPHIYFAAVGQTIRHGVRYLFVDIPTLYDRPGIYNEAGVDYPDGIPRYAALCRAAIGVARHIFQTGRFSTRMTGRADCCRCCCVRISRAILHFSVRGAYSQSTISVIREIFQQACR